MFTLYAILLSLAVSVFCDDEEFSVETYPNPRKGQYRECGLRSPGNVCDPYETLSESERYRINTQLTNFVTKTEENGNTFCAKKGTDAMFVITAQGTQDFADGLRRRWTTIDSQCGRFGVLVLSLENRRIYGSFDERSPVQTTQLQAIIATEEAHIQTGSYTTAVTNILKEVAASVAPAGATTTAHPESTTKSAISQLTMVSLILSLIYFL